MGEVPLYSRFRSRLLGILRLGLLTCRVLIGAGAALESQENAFITGVPRLQENAPPSDPTVGLCLKS